MPAAKKRSKTNPGPDAIALLKADHAKVSALFSRYDHSRNAATKQKLARQICAELETHTTVEEEIFYPTVRQAIDNDDLMDEAKVEHDGAKALIGQIKKGNVGDDRYDAKVTVLSEYIKHHVKEEHQEMFPKARKSGVDLKEMGRAIAQRKRALKSRA